LTDDGWMDQSHDGTGLTARRSPAWQLDGADSRRLNGVTLHWLQVSMA
jgi:hypothetical protein